MQTCPVLTHFVLHPQVTLSVSTDLIRKVFGRDVVKVTVADVSFPKY